MLNERVPKDQVLLNEKKTAYIILLQRCSTFVRLLYDRIVCTVEQCSHNGQELITVVLLPVSEQERCVKWIRHKCLVFVVVFFYRFVISFYLFQYQLFQCLPEKLFSFSNFRPIAPNGLRHEHLQVWFG